MANVFYDEFIAASLGGSFDWLTDGITCSLFDADYTPDESHSWANVSGNIVASSASFPSTSLASNGGALIDDTIVIGGVTTGVGQFIAGVLLHRTSDNLLIGAYTSGLTGFDDESFDPIAADDQTFYIVGAGPGGVLFR